MTQNWIRLWRAVPAGSDDGVFVSSCWSPDMVFALTFGGAGGWLLRGSLAVRGVTVSACEGVASSSPETGAVWHADDPTYRERFERQGVDWLTYDDLSGRRLSVTTCVSRWPLFVYGEVGLGINNVKRRGVCWRVISERGCRALRVTARFSLPSRFRHTAHGIQPVRVTWPDLGPARPDEPWTWGGCPEWTGDWPWALEELGDG